ncbi:MAG: hypothetical protein ABSH52_02825 [Terriglobia bacterium]|jgi:hypothetical protein
MGTSTKNALPLVLRRATRRKAGLKGGDEPEPKSGAGVITTSRKVAVGGDDYTPAQRQIIDARLTEARKGPYHGPFQTAEEAIRFIRKEVRKRKAIKSK